MKAGLTTSVVMHAVLIGLGLFSLSSPHSFEAPDVESLPVDIVPVESITQTQEGDKKAPMIEHSAPRPTVNPKKVQDATRVGDNEVDLKTPPTPEPKPRPVEKAAPAEPEPTPAPEPEKSNKPAPSQASAEDIPVPATEREPEPQPKHEVMPDPAKQAAVAENVESPNVKLPESAPIPEARPRPPQAQTAKAPERKVSDKPPQEKKTAEREPEKTDDLLDEVAALLDKQKSSGGGAKRSTQQASLGTEETTTGEKLTQSEMDALRSQIQRCWNVPVGAANVEDLKVSIQFHLDRAGEVQGSPVILSGGGTGVQRVAAESARRAVLQCAPYDLPSEKYEAWADVIVHFDPSEMF